MKKIATIMGIAVMLFYVNTHASGTGSAENMNTGINENYVMLYYKDITAPKKFYGELIGLPSTMDDEWVALYKLTDTSNIGVVKEGKGAYHKVQDNNAVMLSIVVADVDAWYEKMKSAGTVTFLKEIYNNENVPIRAFLVEDPGGYTVEFFQWLNK